MSEQDIQIKDMMISQL